MHPLARKTDVTVQALGAEVLVYDQRRDAAHSLNATAALVYEHADGTRSVEDLAALLGDRIGLPPDRALVEIALLELQKAGLLDAPAMRPRAVNRRDVLRRLGIAAAAMPIALSVGAPTPLMAQSRSLSSRSKPSDSRPSSPSASLPKPVRAPKGPKPKGNGRKGGK